MFAERTNVPILTELEVLITSILYGAEPVNTNPLAQEEAMLKSIESCCVG